MHPAKVIVNGKNNTIYTITWGFPGAAVIKNPPANAGDARDSSSISGSRISPGVGNGNPLLYSCLENSVDRGVWWDTVHGTAKSRTRLNTGLLG